MKKETARTLMIVAGVLILLIVLVLGSAVWLFTSSVSSSTSDAATATRNFEEVRQRFMGITPVLDIRDERPVVTRKPPESTTGSRLSTLRVIVWDEDDRKFTSVDLPFWLLRLKSGPIVLSDRSHAFGDRLNLTVEELERYGPTLVLDHQGRHGEQVMIWTE